MDKVELRKKLQTPKLMARWLCDQCVWESGLWVEGQGWRRLLVAWCCR